MIQKNYIPKLALVILLTLVPATQAGPIGALFFGVDMLTGGSSFPVSENQSFDAGTTGYSFGFMIPIMLPKVDSFYKVGVTFRDARILPSKDDRNYLSATNEVLIGRAFSILGANLELLPQVGIGMTLENIYSKWGRGYVYDLVFLDIAATILYKVNNFGVGMMINFADGVFSSCKEYDAKQRLGVSFVLRR